MVLLLLEHLKELALTLITSLVLLSVDVKVSLVTPFDRCFREITHENDILLVNCGWWELLDFVEEAVNDRKGYIRKNLLYQVVNSADYLFMLAKLAFPYQIDNGFVEKILTVSRQHLQDGPRTLDNLNVRVRAENNLQNLVGKEPLL